MTHKRPTTLALLMLLTSFGCSESDLGPDVEPDLELVDVEPLELEAPSEPGDPDAAASAEAPCGIEAELGEGSDWLADMTAEELINASSDYLMMAPLRTDDEAGCNADEVVSVRVAQGVSPDAKVTSLCFDELPEGDVMLRECAEHETSLADLGMSSVTTEQDPVGGCYWCTGDTCLNNYNLKQRKEGSTGPCFPNFWDTCCWALNGGCCS